MAIALLLLIPILSIPAIPSVYAEYSDRIVLDNGYFRVTVRTSDYRVGSFTVATGDQHPYPNQDVLYGGEDEDPGTSVLAISLPQYSKTYSTRDGQYVPEGFSFVYLTSIDYSVTSGDNYVRIEWTLPENIVLVEEIYLYGTALENSFVEQRVHVINYNNNPVDVWIMFMWDIMIDGEDGSVIRFWNQDGPVTEWLENATYIGDLSSIDFWQTTNDNENPLFYIWGSIKLPQGATIPTGFIYDDWGELVDHSWNYTVDTSNYIKGDDTAIAYLFIDTVPAGTERVYRQFILAVSGLEEQPPEIITTTITSPGETTTSPVCAPETVTVTETVTDTYTTTETHTYTVTKNNTVTHMHTKTIIMSNETEVLGIRLSHKMILALLLSTAVFFILFLIMLILYVAKK